MAKDRKKLQHIHSSVIDKQPTAASLEVGEIAVNNNADHEFLSLKNSEDRVVRFSSDEQIVTIMEKKEVMPYSGIVDNVHLDTNRSNIEIKFNQVVSDNTVKHNVVNGAKDIDGNLVNPTYDGGLTNGAGFAIDMSQYAMIGANPSFSSVTTTCNATLQGTTTIKGTNNECGSAFSVEDINDICLEASDKFTAYGYNNTNVGISCDGTKVSNATTIKGKEVLIDSSTGEAKIDMKACSHISAATNHLIAKECSNGSGTLEADFSTVRMSADTTNWLSCNGVSAKTDNYNLLECTDGSGVINVDSTDINVTAVTIDERACDGISNVTDNFSVTECTNGNGTTSIKSCKSIFLESKNISLGKGDCATSGQITFETSDLCLVGEDKVNVYGDETNIGLDCNGAPEATTTNVYAKDILVSATTGSINEFAVAENINESAININEIASGNISGVAASNIVEEAGGKILETATGNVETTSVNNSITETAKVNIVETADGKIINTAKGDIEITSETDICEQALNNATFYGSNNTNIGVSCDSTAVAETTTVKGGDVFVDASTSNIELDATIDVIIGADNNICEVANDTASFYGAQTTKIGKSCNDDITQNLEIGANDICIDATDRASVYGGSQSDLGINCAENGRSPLTNIAGNIINISGETINESSELDINERASRNISGVANSNIVEEAGGKIINTATGNVETTSNANITETASGKITNTATDNIELASDKDITVYADDLLCESGSNVTIYAKDNLIIGADSCAGGVDGNYPITYVRRPSECITAKTVDNALSEVLDRDRIHYSASTSTSHIDDPIPESGTSVVRSGSTTHTIWQDSGDCINKTGFTVNDTVVSMSAYTYGASDELAKKYTFWQYIGDKKVDIGEINIPKDHILKDASIVNGHAEGDSFTACTAGDDSCHWYIKLVWNVFDPSTGHADDKVVYLPADNFVQDIDEDNSNTDRGVNVDVWYDGQKNIVSATTKVTIKNADGTGTSEFARADGFHSLTSYTLNSVSGDVKSVASATNWTYDPFDKKVTITAATDVSHINRKTVSWSYGDVKDLVGNSYDPGAGTVNTMVDRTMSFVIPQCVNHLNRHMIKFQSGSTSSFDNQTYDPGKDCSNSAETINIPTSFDHLSEYNGTCYTLSHDVCMGSNTIVANSFYNSSDMNLKENIASIGESDYEKVNNIDFKSFNFKSDELKTKTYGVIAQDVQNAGLNEIVKTNDEGNLSVDYISLLILKIGSLENEVKKLREELNKK